MKGLDAHVISRKQREPLNTPPLTGHAMDLEAIHGQAVPARRTNLETLASSLAVFAM